MVEPTRQIYEFGGFRLDALKHSLQRIVGENVPLKPKAREILLALVERRGETVSKEELIRLIWGDSFVEEGNLTVNMSLLRKALGDTSEPHQFILTVPGKGYRFVADVREISEDGDEKKIESEGQSEENSNAFAVPKRKNLNLLYPGGIAVILIFFGVYWFFIRQTDEIAPFANLRLTKLTTSGKVKTAAVSPDGKYVVYAVDDAGGQTLRLKQLSAETDVQIFAPKKDVNYYGLVFSGDAERLYLLRGDKQGLHSLYRTAMLGGASAKLAEDVDSPPALSPDGKTLAFLRGLPDQDETALFIIGTDGGEPQRLASRSSAEGFIISSRPSFSPDGRKIVCAVKKQDAKGKFAALVAVDAQSGKIDELNLPRFASIAQTVWAAEMKGLIIAAASENAPSLNQIWYISYPNGEAKRITNDLNDYRELSLTADGKTIVTVNTDLQTNIWLVPDFDATRAKQITSTNYDGANGLTWMPDGGLIYTSQNAEKLNLWSVSSDGGNRQITSGAGNNFQPAAAPDGKQIAFVSDRSGGQHIWIADADGGNARQLTKGIDDNLPNWSPDGKTIVYRSYTQGNPYLFSIAIEGGTPVQLTDKISGRPKISPDGQKILYSRRAEALTPPKLAITTIGGGQPEKIFNINGNLYRWTADGQAILFINQFADGGANLWRQTLDVESAPMPVTDWKNERIYWFDISPDGKTIACARGTSQSDVVLISENPNRK